jgi:hypothetical protein
MPEIQHFAFSSTPQKLYWTFRCSRACDESHIRAETRIRYVERSQRSLEQVRDDVCSKWRSPSNSVDSPQRPSAKIVETVRVGKAPVAGFRRSSSKSSRPGTATKADLCERTRTFGCLFVFFACCVVAEMSACCCVEHGPIFRPTVPRGNYVEGARTGSSKATHPLKGSLAPRSKKGGFDSSRLLSESQSTSLSHTPQHPLRIISPLPSQTKRSVVALT